MMRSYLDAWLLGPRRRRAICAVAWVGLMAVLAALPSGFSESRREEQRERELRQRIRLRQLWLQERSQTMAEPPPARPFSALRLVQEGGGQVVSWQADGGTLALSIDWMSLPGLFTRLAESDVALREFQLESASPALRLTLRLETEK